MKLIDLLVKELPKRGGWPEFASICWCDPDGEIRFDNYTARDFYPLTDFVDGDDRACSIGNASNGIHEAQYEAALAASEGWIEWHSGECPVDSDAIVEVKFRNPSRNKFNNDRAGDFNWSHDGFDGDIIVYRLQHPGFNSRANDDLLEQDLNECIGQDVDIPEWSSDGLPPVGCECETIHRSCDSWQPIKVIAVNDGAVFGFWVSGNTPCALPVEVYQFRPLRTEAEKARDSAVDAMQDYFPRGGWDYDDICSLYDAIAAGKIPGVKLEGK